MKKPPAWLTDGEDDLSAKILDPGAIPSLRTLTEIALGPGTETEKALRYGAIERDGRVEDYVRERAARALRRTEERQLAAMRQDVRPKGRENSKAAKRLRGDAQGKLDLGDEGK